jgi:hypothetical protein
MKERDFAVPLLKNLMVRDAASRLLAMRNEMMANLILRSGGCAASRRMRRHRNHQPL